MPVDAILKSIQFRTTVNSYLSFVCCTTTDGSASPLFSHNGNLKSFEHYQTINFDANRPIRRVLAQSDFHSAFRITFLDAQGEEIDYYRTTNQWGRSGPIYDIHPGNEEVIGVYGIRAVDQNWFTGFGFIVRVTHEE